ncbi:MAG: hypothetical protein K0S39_4949 [Paenibacillus sp.]|nr:hypothetical protein [Paenibacillus sp.]
MGGGDAGTSGSSGLVIKFRKNSLLAKINRKRQFYDKGLKEVLLIAQLLEHARSARKPGYEVVEPIIHYFDGLPKVLALQIYQLIRPTVKLAIGNNCLIQAVI